MARKSVVATWYGPNNRRLKEFAGRLAGCGIKTSRPWLVRSPDYPDGRPRIDVYASFDDVASACAEWIAERVAERDTPALTWLVHKSVWHLIDLYPEVNRQQMERIVFDQILGIVEVKKR